MGVISVRGVSGIDPDLEGGWLCGRRFWVSMGDSNIEFAADPDWPLRRLLSKRNEEQRVTNVGGDLSGAGLMASSSKGSSPCSLCNAPATV